MQIGRMILSYIYWIMSKSCWSGPKQVKYVGWQTTRRYAKIIKKTRLPRIVAVSAGDCMRTRLPRIDVFGKGCALMLFESGERWQADIFSIVKPYLIREVLQGCELVPSPHGVDESLRSCFAGLCFGEESGE